MRHDQSCSYHGNTDVPWLRHQVVETIGNAVGVADIRIQVLVLLIEPFNLDVVGIHSFSIRRGQGSQILNLCREG